MDILFPMNGNDAPGLKHIRFLKTIHRKTKNLVAHPHRIRDEIASRGTTLLSLPGSPGLLASLRPPAHSLACGEWLPR